MSWLFHPLKPLFYDVVMIDPPWQWKNWSPNGGWKSPSARYSLMTIKAIEKLPVRDLLRSGGVLWCWATWPLLDLQIDCVRKWGLTYKTGGAWEKLTPSGKQRMGTGYILRSVCEPFLICTTGAKHAFGDRRARNLIKGIAREHSRKPDEAYQIAERLNPHAFRADVFSRQERPGWDSWGNEVGKFK